jgi:hypothetical protein
VKRNDVVWTTCVPSGQNAPGVKMVIPWQARILYINAISNFSFCTPPEFVLASSCGYLPRCSAYWHEVHPDCLSAWDSYIKNLKTQKEQIDKQIIEALELRPDPEISTI